MRTLIAMTCAVLAAGFAMLTFSQNVADNLVATWRFESPGDVAAAHSVTFLLMTVLALFAGWAVGWMLGFPFRRQEN